MLDQLLRLIKAEVDLFLVSRLHLLLVEYLVDFIHIIGINDRISVYLCFKVIDCSGSNWIWEQRSGIIRSKCPYNILIAIDKIEDKGLFLKGWTYSVQTGKCLYRIDTLELLHDIHCTELRLVKACLILVSNQKHLIIVLVELFGELIFGNTVDTRLCVFCIIIRELHLARKRNKRTNALVSLFRAIVLKCLTILDGGLSWCGDDHCLCLSAKFLHNSCAEMLYDDLYTLGNIRFVQLYETCNLPFCTCCLHFRIFFDFLVDLIERLICSIILQHIEDKTFLNSLFHWIHMECFALSVCINRAKKL